MFTIVHELGYVMCEANLIPRTVRHTYSILVQPGASEQPSCAYMFYITNPSRLAPADGRPFDTAFTRQGLEPR